MGVYTVQVVKALDSVDNPRTWMNVYHINAGTIGDATGPAELLLDAEKTMHASTVKYVRLVIFDPTRVERRIVEPISGVSGDRTASGLIIPAWNVVDVMFTTASNPRKLRKYFRVQLGEGDIEGPIIDSGLQFDWQAVWDTVVADVFSYCAPNGDSVTGAEVLSAVSMRQEQWHRRGRPGFHRGYIPN